MAFFQSFSGVAYCLGSLRSHPGTKFAPSRNQVLNIGFHDQPTHDHRRPPVYPCPARALATALLNRLRLRATPGSTRTHSATFRRTAPQAPPPGFNSLSVPVFRPAHFPAAPRQTAAPEMCHELHSANQPPALLWLMSLRAHFKQPCLKVYFDEIPFNHTSMPDSE